MLGHTPSLSTPPAPPARHHAPAPAQAASLRFGRDLRLPEVRRLLRSSAPTPLRLAGVPEPSDTEGTAAQQLKLTVLAIRSCALPLGKERRGRGGVAMRDCNRANLVF